MSYTRRSTSLLITTAVGIALVSWQILRVLSTGGLNLPVVGDMLFQLSREVDVLGLGLLVIVVGGHSALRQRVGRSRIWRVASVALGIVVSAYAGLFMFLSISRLSGLLYFAPGGVAGIGFLVIGFAGVFD